MQLGNMRSAIRSAPDWQLNTLTSKRALMGFTGVRPAKSDSKPKPFVRGHFLDLRTTTFALTDRGHPLESACKAFNVEHGKTKVKEHGKMSNEYIDYNRRDVSATAELAYKVLGEYDRHAIDLQETKAFSPASIGKAYLRKMGITPVLQRHTNFQPYLGYAQTAFFGGRTGAHIRKMAIPVVYTDFLSMYPTVNSLLKLWDFVIARHIRVVDHCKDEITAFLKKLKPDDLFRPETWKHLRAFVLVKADGDILPTRGPYNPETNDWQVAVNHLYAERDDDALWFSLPDVAASVILTGRIPKTVDAFRLEPSGVLPNLHPVKLRGTINSSRLMIGSCSGLWKSGRRTIAPYVLL